MNNMGREEIIMNMIKKSLFPALIAMVLLLSLVGCGKKSEKPVVQQSAKDTKSIEHPAKEHPTNEHPAKEHPTNEHPAKEHPSNDESSNDHPSNNK